MVRRARRVTGEPIMDIRDGKGQPVVMGSHQYVAGLTALITGTAKDQVNMPEALGVLLKLQSELLSGKASILPDMETVKRVTQEVGEAIRPNEPTVHNSEQLDVLVRVLTNEAKRNVDIRELAGGIEVVMQDIILSNADAANAASSPHGHAGLTGMYR